MKQSIIYWSLLAVTATSLLTGCSDDENLLAAGEGSVSLSASISGDAKVVSRAGADELRELYGSSLTVWLTKPGSGPVRKYEGIDDLPSSPVALPSGSYVAEAWAGDSVSASWDKKYFKGYEPFDVIKMQTTPVNINCKIANTLASVNWETEVDEVLKPGYSMTVGHSRGTLTFEGRDDRKAYFMMPPADKDLTVEITGESLDGKAYKQSAVIADVKQGYEYVIKVKASDKELDPVGGAWFDIEIDETEVIVEDEVVISLAPLIKGINFNIAEPQTSEQGKMGRKSIYITAAEELTSVMIESDELNALIGHSDLDLVLAPNKDYVITLDAAGIKLQRFTDNEGRLTNLRVNFEQEYTNTLDNGTHTFKFTAVDGDKSSEATLTLEVSDAPVALLPVDESDVEYTTVTLRANILKQENLPAPSRAANGFNYRKTGGSWAFVEGKINGSEMTATVSGLSDGSAYEYTAVYNGFETPSLKFTTLAYPQLPNAGFEEWCKSGKVQLICASEDQMWWDSGNHGSATMSKSLTEPDSQVKHSGQYSARLKSQYVGMMGIGAFAAGNLFSGHFLGTENTTKGILGWGRKFDFKARPKALTGWVKYAPGVVVSGNNKGSGSHMSVGDMDRGIIYIALLTDDLTTQGDGTWPVEVRTKGPKLFDKVGANVVAYGEIVFNEATAGDGMIQFNIPIETVHGDLKEAYIMIVASASYYGDYYEGGEGSTMWLDDFQLVY